MIKNELFLAITKILPVIPKISSNEMFFRQKAFEIPTQRFWPTNFQNGLIVKSKNFEVIFVCNTIFMLINFIISQTIRKNSVMSQDVTKNEKSNNQ